MYFPCVIMRLEMSIKNMKIVTWNINGIRTFKNGIKKALDSFDADIICVQETKVTRDLLDERTAIVDGYNSYFSFSRGRSGYSGVATYCKDSATPFAAEEGLTGLLTNHGEAVSCYGDLKEFSSEELQLLDNEGRAVITQHRVTGTDGPETLAILNVYCPRADPEKPERKTFKLQFYKLLQNRAEAILGAGSHVIVLGDINTSHRPIDHCDPDDIDNFEDNPARTWLNSFLCGSTDVEDKDCDKDNEDENLEILQKSLRGGQFIDTFRHFHPTRTNAFTCWSTLTGARQTNYGTRIDYIFANSSLVLQYFLAVDIMPEVEGSDHCPVWAQLRCALLPSPRCPRLCTRHMPEFVGRQQKLSRFLVKVGEQQTESNTVKDALPGSQESGEIRENLNPLGSVVGAGKKRAPEGASESSAPKGKRSKQVKTAVTKPQGSLLAFFKPKPNPVAPSRPDQSIVEQESKAEDAQVDRDGDAGGRDFSAPDRETVSVHAMREDCVVSNYTQSHTEGYTNGQNSASPTEEVGDTKKGMRPDFWKTVLHGPPPPLLCKTHQEPCVLRTVKKPGPNLGRQFFVCARPQGHASNPQARCNFFAWVDKGK